MKHPAARARMGFTVIEMLVILGLMGVAALVMAHLFTASMRAIETGRSSQDQQSEIEHLARALKRDVWGASSIDVPDPRTIILSRADGTQARWRIEEARVVRSNSGASEGSAEQWWGTALPLAAEQRGAMLIITSLSQRGDMAYRRCFISQALTMPGEASP